MIDLEAIKARCDAATPGPWTHKNYPKHHSCWIEDAWDGDLEADANTDFMLCARQDIPALLARVEELEKNLTKAIADIPHRCWKCGYAHCNSENECDMAHYTGNSDDCQSWYWRGGKLV